MNKFSDAELQAYLDEAAGPDRTNAIEAAVRDDEALRTRLAELVSRRDAGLHSLGEVWRRKRLTCPSREQLGSYLLGVLQPEEADYLQFHLEVVGCRWCSANVQDLRQQHEQAEAADVPRRRGKYFESSVGRLSQSG